LTRRWAGRPEDDVEKKKRGPWSVVSSREVYDNRWISVTHHEVVTPAGGPGIYGTVHHKNLAIGIVPVDAELHTYLVGQYRFALEAYSWEIPEGGGVHGVDPKESAARELREETGLRAARWQTLVECDLSNSVTDERAISFLAWELTQGQSALEPTEDITVRRLPLVDVFRMVEEGEIRDALSIITLQALRLLHLTNRLPLFGPGSA
jgi:8-oxo-dGTP pyrophosphatase MutT (NUDIX family)